MTQNKPASCCGTEVPEWAPESALKDTDDFQTQPQFVIIPLMLLSSATPY